MEGAYMTVGDWIDGIVAEAVEEKDKALADKDAEITNIIISKDAEIARLKEELARQKNRG